MTQNSWTLNLPGWIIQDGDFPDLRAGQEADFGVELGLIPAWTAPGNRNASISARSLDRVTFEFVGELVFKKDGVWTMDVGILVCSEGELPPVYGDRNSSSPRVGDRFVGRGSLSVLADAVDVRFAAAPPHRYSWMIDRIELDTTPWIEAEPRVFVRDADNVSYRQVVGTDAWHHDGGRSEYVLHCSLLSGPTR